MMRSESDGNVRSSARWVATSQAARSGLQLASIAILARMLESSDYGLMALAGIVINLAYAVRDFGTTSAVIQRPILDESFEASVLLANVLIGATLTFVVVALAVPAAKFFNVDGLRNVLLSLSPIFIIGSLSILQQAKLERLANFKKLAIIEIFAALIGILIAIAAALYGLGVFSLVFQTLGSTLFTTIALISQKSTRFPVLRPSRQSISELFSMSGSITLYSLLLYFKNSVDSFILGKLLGNSILGAYSIACKVALVPIQNIASVCGRSLLPSMSAAQNDVPQLGVIYVRSLAIVVFVCLPSMAGLWIVRESFVLTVLGPRWIEAVGILAWLTPIGVLNAVESTTGTVLVARGKPKSLIFLGIFSVFSLIVAMLVGSFFGLSGALCGLLLATFATTVLSMKRAIKEVSISFYKIFRSIAPIIVSAFVASIFSFFISKLESVQHLNSIATLAVVLPIMFCTYVTLAFFIAKQPLFDVLSLVGLYRNKR